LTTKIHGAADGRDRSLAVHLTAGQVHDIPQFAAVLAGIRVPRTGVRRSRTRPDRIVADKA
jgi:Transposase DDE domain